MKNEEATLRTTTSLVKIARNHFTEHGYNNVSLEAIAEEGSVTRGAIYHHFKSKKGLFASVLENVQQDVATRIEAEASKHNDPWQQLILGCLGFVKCANAEENKRILLMDAPSVLGWDTWRKSDQENSVNVLKKHIDYLQAQGYLQDGVDTKLMALSISGALNELSFVYPKNSTSEEDNHLLNTISLLVSGFRK